MASGNPNNFLFRKWIALPYAVLCSIAVAALFLLLCFGEFSALGFNIWLMAVVSLWGGIPLLAFSLILPKLNGSALILGCAIAIAITVLPVVALCIYSGGFGPDLVLLLPNLLSIFFILIETEIVRKESFQL